MADAAEYVRPVKATLLVRLDNGEEWEATPEDLTRFGYGRRLDLYTRAERMLREALGIDDWRDLTHDGPNLVRYLIECAICYQHSPWADESGELWPQVDNEPTFLDEIRAVFAAAAGSPETGEADA